MIGRVFIIDDDLDHAESIGDLLEQRGYEVEVAVSGEEGARRFREAEFDLVLMDMKLPGMNGVETFAEFKKIRPDAQVLMMTGYSVEQLLAQAVQNGALGVLRKPFAIADLLDVLDNIKPRGLVLVADDDPDFAASLEPVLRRHGYSVKVARTGQEALDQVATSGVNCLILDLKMPVLSGMEVYLRLKETGRAIPTILVTAFAQDEGDVISSLRPVTEGLLIKPFDPAELLNAIDTAIAGKVAA
jgi:two-component system, NtrC family, response regulator HydG